jgi:hypothetical protein
VTTPLTLFLNQAVSAEFVTASQLYPTVGGTIGILKTTLIGTASGWGEIWAQGNAGAWAAAGSMGGPTGHGWFFDATTLDGQMTDAGIWTPTTGYKMSVAAGSMTADIWVNIYVYNSGTYTLIGSCSLLAQSITQTVASFTFAGTSLPAGIFPVGSKLYIDNWLNITTPGTNASATCAVRQATTTANGAVTAQIVTPGYDPAPVAATGTPRYTPRGLLSTIIPVIVTEPLPYIRRALTAVVVYENRTFIPRALSAGVYIPDTVLWVPRGMLSTLSLPLNSFIESLVVSDSALFTGTALPIDALSATDSLLGADTALPVDALTVTDALLGTDTDLATDALTVSDIQSSLFRWPVDALTAADSTLYVDVDIPLDALSAVVVDLDIDIYDPLDSLSADDSASTMTSNPSGGITNNNMASTDALVVADSLLAIDGSLYTEANSASDSLLGQGSGLLVDSLATSDALLGTDTELASDALSVTDLIQAARGATALESLVASDMMVVSDAYLPAEVQSVVDALLAIDGAGWVDLLSVSDTSSMVSAGIAVALFLSATWVTRDGKVTWKTRDENAAWINRDEKDTWDTRDDKAAWDSRDDQITWKTRQ